LTPDFFRVRFACSRRGALNAVFTARRVERGVNGVMQMVRRKVGVSKNGLDIAMPEQHAHAVQVNARRDQSRRVVMAAHYTIQFRVLSTSRNRSPKVAERRPLSNGGVFYTDVMRA